MFSNWYFATKSWLWIDIKKHLQIFEVERLFKLSLGQQRLETIHWWRQVFGKCTVDRGSVIAFQRKIHSRIHLISFCLWKRFTSNCQTILRQQKENGHWCQCKIWRMDSTTFGAEGNLTTVLLTTGILKFGYLYSGNLAVGNHTVGLFTTGLFTTKNFDSGHFTTEICPLDFLPIGYLIADISSRNFYHRTFHRTR